ncbi:DUF2177 family protein [Reyranella aquatilis]|uniref:DUF2177 family protein n=1 Tax=Reyranella aquatilis TaxID=2035356 RepID=A0ABS8KTW3_9HYPH|nr:DUF2177 family protein [Reyranella aquatilis]MCC8429532.1 DUF2177 family protein [Reyranella aquatilis]
MQLFAAYLATLSVFIALNLTWNGLVVMKLYRRELRDVLAETPRLLPAALFYLIHAGGVLLLVVRSAIDSGGWHQVAGLGAVFGLCAYATYDLTNAATLRRWPGNLMALDITCGVIFTSIASVAGFLAARMIATGAA